MQSPTGGPILALVVWLRDWARRSRSVLWPLWAIGLVVLGYGSLSPQMAPPTGVGGVELELDKLIHLAAYAPFSAFAWVMGVTGRRGWAISALVFALGMAFEIGQAYVPGRTSSWDDLLANALGVLLGVALGRVIARL